METFRRHRHSLLGSLSVAFAIPIVLFKLLRMMYSREYFYGSLMGKVVLITGASGGLGEAMAHEFYKHGCQLVLCSRRRHELDRVRSDLLRTHATVSTLPPIVVELDLNNINSLPGIVSHIVSIVGKVDILINNGGISHRGSVLQTKPDVDIKVMMVNYFGTAALTKAVLPTMIQQQSGHIVFISSVQGLLALPHRSAYGASKHALQAFADSLRAEVATDGVHVTVVSPGYINTALSRNALMGNGGVYGQMDDNTLNGYSPGYVAEKLCKAVVDKKKEIIIARIVPKLGIFLRNILPSWYFSIMVKRSQKATFTN